MALLNHIPTVLEANEACYTLTDEQLQDGIREHTLRMDPHDWLGGYECSEEPVLATKDTGRIWVPPSVSLPPCVGNCRGGRETIDQDLGVKNIPNPRGIGRHLSRSRTRRLHPTILFVYRGN